MHYCSIKYLVQQIIRYILLFIAVCFFVNTNAQQKRTDSLNSLILRSKVDSVKIGLYEQLGQVYRNEKKMDAAVLSYKQVLKIDKSINNSAVVQERTIGSIDYILYEMGAYAESLAYAGQQLALSTQLNDTSGQGAAHLVFGHDYRELGDYRQSLNHYFKAKEFYKAFHLGRGHREDNTYTLLCIAQVYLRMNYPDSALFYSKQAYTIATNYSEGVLILLSLRIFADIYLAKGDTATALTYYRQYIPDYVIYKERNRDLGFVLNSMAKIFQQRGQMDSLVFYATKAYENALQFSDQQNLFTAGLLLSEYYAGRDDHLAYKYLKIADEAKDSMKSIEKLKQAQLLSFNEDVREKEHLAADAKEAAKRRMSIWIAAVLIAIISILIVYRIRQLRLKYKTILEQKESDKLRTRYEKMLLDLEAKALRAQMNPHFIFNCLNSIKSLIQQHKEENSITYLTTFSKLLRTLFNNADKKEISLFDEIETCRYYLQLEAMRFDSKFSYQINIDENTDLKSVQVPALIIQPFIENAIWHGIVPNNNVGCVILSVIKKNDFIEVIIDDDGIGRESSQQNKPIGGLSHQSKGVNLTQSRLELNNLLNQRQALLEIIDKKDENGTAKGTTVIIKIKEEIA